MSKTQLEHLLPCPFCGSTNIGLPFNDRCSQWVTCLDCDCDGPLIPTQNQSTRTAAIKAWNQRQNQNHSPLRRMPLQRAEVGQVTRPTRPRPGASQSKTKESFTLSLFCF